MRKILRTAILAVAAVLSACAQNPATGGMMFTAVSHSREMQIGQQTAETAIRENGLYRPESRTTQYVTNLCQSVWATTEAAAQPISCIVLDSDEYNAWATPGYVNVYRGLLPYVNSEAELAAVIAHESGHVTARHIARGLTQQVVVGSLVTAGALIVGMKSDDALTANIAYGLGGIAGGATIAAYGRQHEREADSLGQRYMQRAGYDPREEVSMITAMQTKEGFDKQLAAAFNNGQAEGQGLLAELYASHPATPERRANAVAQAGAEPDGSLRLPQGTKPATPAADPQGRARYLEAINGLPVGPARKYGVAGRGYLAFPAGPRFKWRLADGFTTRYIPSGRADKQGIWQGVHPVSGVRFTALVEELKDGLNPAVALQRVVSGMSAPQALKLADGSTAYTGTVGGSKPRRVVAVAGHNRLAILVYTYPSAASQAAEDATLMQITQTSYGMSEAEARGFSQLEVAVFNAKPGDTVATRAAALPTGALREEWFRALNNLPAPAELITGQSYKTVTDPNL